MPLRRLLEWITLLDTDGAEVKEHVTRLLKALALTFDAREVTLEIGSAGAARPLRASTRDASPEAPAALPGPAGGSRFSIREILGYKDEILGKMTFHWDKLKNPKDATFHEQECVHLFRTLLLWTCSPARLDPSTGLPNHVQLGADLARFTARPSGTEASLILVELIDHDIVRRMFTAAGSEATDALLMSVAGELRALLKPPSRLYYVGVGRFAIVAHRTGIELTQLLAFIERIMRSPVQGDGIAIQLSAVVGFVPWDEIRDHPTDVLRRATVAAQQAKLAKVLSARYDQAYDRQQIRSYGLLQDIPRAIANNEFYLVFQPKLTLGTGRYEGAEALLRWNHPTLGGISPGEFIPLAENTDLIHPVTRWVLVACLEALQDLQRRGLVCSIALNVSAHNLADPKFADFLRETLAAYSIAPAQLQVECTEYSAMASPVCLDTLHAISALGCEVALDDFGSGYSNLSSLNNLPLDYLKIDRSLILSIDSERKAHQLLDGVVRLGKRLGFRIVAEGVETEAVLRVLESLGMDQAQGYYLSRPLDHAHFVEFLAAQGTARA